MGLDFSVYLCCVSDGFVAATLDFSFLMAIIFAIPEDQIEKLDGSLNLIPTTFEHTHHRQAIGMA